MGFEIFRSVGAVTRSVGRLERDGRPARAVIAECGYDTTVEDLWDIVTNPERIPRWLLPVTGDLRLGGRYQLEGNAGGEITACEPPTYLAVTWEFGESVSWVEVRLTDAEAGGAALQLKHTAHVDDHWDKYGPGATGVGWDMALIALRHYLTHGQSLDSEKINAWLTSDEGNQFVTQSAGGWGSAAIASGDDPASAEAAADRTFKAYTGQAETPETDG